MIKSILGGKSKNLFDISKVITSNVVKRNGNSLICSVYGTSIGTLGSICPTLKPSDLITISFKCASEGVPSKYMAFDGRTFYSGATFLVSEIGLSASLYLYKTDYEHMNIPNKTTYSDIQIELGSTATEYVPHELTSYKSIMKVSDGRFVTSFDERMPCKTKNLINSQQIYQISQHMDVTIWQGEVNYVCTFSYELSMLEPNTGMAALFEFVYSDGTYSYIVSRDKYRVLSQITDSKKLTKIMLINWSNIKGIISNIQLEKGSTATDYVPYRYV